MSSTSNFKQGKRINIGDLELPYVEVITDHVEGRYPSDHFPVQVNFTFT